MSSYQNGPWISPPYLPRSYPEYTSYLSVALLCATEQMPVQFLLELELTTP